jgi:hypothetical protein
MTTWIVLDEPNNPIGISFKLIPHNPTCLFSYKTLGSPLKTKWQIQKIVGAIDITALPIYFHLYCSLELSLPLSPEPLHG